MIEVCPFWNNQSHFACYRDNSIPAYFVSLVTMVRPSNWLRSSSIGLDKKMRNSFK